jgi:hypothetical protein
MVGYGACIAGGAMLFAREREIRDRLLLAAVVIPSTIAPFGFFRGETAAAPGPAVAIFLALAGIYALLSRKFVPKAASLLAAVELTLGICLYLFHLADGSLPWRSEVAILVAGGGLLALVTWALVTAHQRTQALVLSASLLCVPLIARLAMLLLGTDGLGNSTPVALAFGLMAASLGGAVLAYLSKWESAVILLWTIFMLGLGTYGALAVTDPPRLSTELIMLFGFAGVLVATSLASLPSGEDSPASSANVVWGVSAALGGLLFVRLADLLLTVPSIGLQQQAAGILGASVVVGLTAAVGRRKAISEVALVSALFTVGAMLFYWLMLDQHRMPFGQDVLSVCLLLASAVVSALSLLHVKADRSTVIYGASTLCWVFISRLGYLVLTDANVGIKANASVSIAWTFTALVLIILGFTASIRELRYMSFAVFGCTLVKVLMVDLVALDPILRVIILLLLGLVMLGGGYWYIKVQKPSQQVEAP